MAATIFFSVELLTPRGLVRCMVLLVIDIATRRIEIPGVKVDPDSQWMQQMARNMTDCFNGFLLGTRHLIHDRDRLFTKQFDEMIESINIEVIKIPTFAPDMNAYTERFVQIIKHECLNNSK